MAFDIANFDTRTKSEEGVAFPVLNPKSGAAFLDSDGNPITITLLGRNSDAFRKVQRAIQLRDADRESKQVRKTEEDFERDRYDCLCAMTKAWTFDMMDGAPIPCTPANVAKLWSDPRWIWLRVQMYSYVLQEGHFLANSAAA